MRTATSILLLTSSVAFGQFANAKYANNGNTMTVTLSSRITHAGPPVVGLPYSAVQVSENRATLADGTIATQPGPTRKFWRDSQGRVRTERRIGPASAPGQADLMLVEVRDPVSGVYFVLDDQNKVAHRFAVPQAAAPEPVAAASTTVKTVGPPPGASVESLGMQTVEGLPAEGRRTTRTIDDNGKIITVISESWIAKDLGLLVMHKTTDPRSGEHTTRWTQINRAEPDAALFQIPKGYAVVDETDSFTLAMQR